MLLVGPTRVNDGQKTFLVRPTRMLFDYKMFLVWLTKMKIDQKHMVGPNRMNFDQKI